MMKLRLLVLMLVVSIHGIGCASLQARPALRDIVAGDLSGVLSLLGGEGGLAMACPIAPDEALTNGHVVGKDYHRYIWEACPLGVTSSGAGCALGLLGAPSTTTRDLFRDLARVAPKSGTAFPRSYPIAAQPPQPGDKLRFKGWDFRRRKDAFAPREFDAVVLRLRNGHLVMWQSGVPGTSGSCVLNERGEVVAINAAGKDIEDRSQVGVAVGVWGSLLELGR